MSYPVETKLVSQYLRGSQRWHTPAQARNYYGRYNRTGITIHWWGLPGQTGNHDQIVNYFWNRTDGSVNYVLSNGKITKMVEPDNVAFTSQSGNPTTVSIEHQPNLGAEGYKRSGWLVWRLELKYGRKLPLYPHKYWWATQCPGTIDIARIRREADKWRAGGYNPKPVPVPTPTPTPAPKPPATVKLTITDIVNKQVKTTKATKLWDLHFKTWADAKAVKSLPAGTQIEVSAIAKHPLGGSYYLSEYSYAKGIGNGINVKDCVDVPKTGPTPPPTQVKPPVPVVVPVLTKDQQQDAEIKEVKGLLQKIVDFLTSKLGFSK